MVDFRSVLVNTRDMEFPIGEDSGGQFVKANLREINHLLVSGTTGSGKSIFIESMILTLASHNPAEKLRFIFCDTKMTEFLSYKSMEHTLIPVCTEENKICAILQWLLFEGFRRLKLFSEKAVKDIDSFNDRAWENFESEIPHIVTIIDDLSSIVLRHEKETVDSVKRLFSIGRIAGIHIVAITQTPAIKQIKHISALFSSKISFLSTQADLRFITGKQNLGPLHSVGDAWYCTLSAQYRIHAIKVSREEAQEILETVACEDNFDRESMEKIEAAISPALVQTAQESNQEYDELFPAAVEAVLETGQASVSMLQRRLKLSYSRAARLIDQMEERGYVGPFEGSKPRLLLLTRAMWHEILGIQNSVTRDDNDCASNVERPNFDGKIEESETPKSETVSETSLGKNAKSEAISQNDNDSISEPSIAYTKIGEIKRKERTALFLIFVGISLLSFFTWKWRLEVLVLGCICIILGAICSIGHQSVCCPYCKQIGRISEFQKEYVCKSCKKRSVRSGEYLKPVP